MDFFIDYLGECEQRLLKYLENEYSFDSEPLTKEINFDIVINKLILSVIDDSKVAQIWGFCPHSTWIKTDYNVPHHTKGLLKVVDDLEQGFSYKINREGEWPIYINQSTGWICIGHPENKGEAVEFMNNCVAVVDNHHKLVSLWLKPQIEREK